MKVEEPALSTPSFVELIEAKRDGATHASEEIALIVRSFSVGATPDYQMAAWLMAAFLQGLSEYETVALTDAMAHSGEMVDLSGVPGRKVDKHSTGGVGDTTTLVVAPLVAACGVKVAKMSGRGLGHTGGTLDKLESIPGFSVEMSVERFVEQVRDVGVAVIAQSPEVDPADKKMYALRDVTGTVPSIPLIVASIVSKKIAGGADAILLDVKVGSGAFMKDEAHARRLAGALRVTGAKLGRRIDAVMTDMDQPLGRAVGNALEVREAVETLRGDGPEDLDELCRVLAAKLVLAGEGAEDIDDARYRVDDVIASGEAVESFRGWVEAQGGDPRIAEDVSLLPSAPLTRDVRAGGTGFVARIQAEETGRAAMVLGAGRATKDAVIDPAAGVVLAVKVGDRVEDAEQPLAVLHGTSEEALDAAEERLRAAVTLSPEKPVIPPLFHELLGADNAPAGEI